ncbi:TlpA family protein disulfide reductase [Montanilutibacter psychrotolerans]|uniref:TlpA family protein disulfide reductase n=1 Tax=Montanilutibacter psychrotolerans TaxID=1327343 RepID=A0A3M8STK1_9GAMM|nr:TlpA disulfide reductase family protein [Lysobacter psychrotolerans]RNF84123.1 TlpA family protein disulfide reductase [Lysobacter psychrotolerans]
MPVFLPRLRSLLPLMATLALGACDASTPVTASGDTPAAPTGTSIGESAATPASDAPASDTPDLRIALLDGGNYDLAAHRGKWVVVNFWATWCKPCLKEMPELSALDTARDHIEVLGLAYDDIEPAAMREFLQRRPVAYPVAIVDTYDPPKAFDTPRGLPMTYLIGPDGKIVDKVLGPVTAESIEAAIAKAGGRAPGAKLEVPAGGAS